MIKHNEGGGDSPFQRAMTITNLKNKLTDV